MNLTQTITAGATAALLAVATPLATAHADKDQTVEIGVECDSPCSETTAPSEFGDRNTEVDDAATIWLLMYLRAVATACWDLDYMYPSPSWCPSDPA